MRSRWFAGCIAAGLLLSACSGNSDGGIQPIPEDGASTEAPDEVEDDTPDDPEPDDEPDDPFALPDEIDEEYLQRVVDELMAIRTRVLARAIIASETADAQDEEGVRLLGSAYTGPALASNLAGFADRARSSNLDEIFRDPDELEDERLIVVEAFDAAEGCAILTAQYDDSGVRLEPSDREPHFLMVLEHQPQADDANVTGWKIRVEESLLMSDNEPATREQVVELDSEAVSGLLDDDCVDEDAA